MYCFFKKKNVFRGKFPLWRSRLRVRLQWPRSLRRHRFDSQPAQWVKGSGLATAVPQIESMAWELPWAAIKKKIYEKEITENHYQCVFNNWI